ncbi:hypothetical protein SLA2020_422100 [Shorea laevis]
MGHRHLTNTIQFFEIEHYQNPTNVAAEQSDVPIGGAVVPAIGSFVYSRETVPRSRFCDATQQDSERRPVEHSSQNHRVGGSHAHAFHSGQSYDSYSHFSSAGSMQATPENDASHSHSNHYNGPIVREVEGGLLDSVVNSGRGPVKRKGSAFESGSTSRCYDAGSSSNSLEIHSEKRVSDCDGYPSGFPGLPHHRGGNQSIGGEAPIRNVRRRCRIDLEPNPTRTYLSSYSSHFNSATTHQSSDSGRMDVTYFNGVANAYNQNYVGISPPVHGRFTSPGNVGLRNEMNQYFAGGSTAQIGGFNNYPILGRVPVSSAQYGHNVHAQVMREGHSNFSQAAATSDTSRTSSSHVSQETALMENHQQFPSETYSSRFSRPLSARGWRNHRSDARTRLERFQSFSTVNRRHRMRSEALLMGDGSNIYGSRNLFDQYRDMRLDIDNMSYEELLALGERIGNVSTGLSENVMSECLKVSTYSSDKKEEDATCSICLEEYKNDEENGTLKCGHNYHVVCIKRWLSMKNACPICKAPAIADTSKEE